MPHIPIHRLARFWRRWTLPSEADVLALSAGLTALLALFGVIYGLVVNSRAIVFDGVFESIDAAMSGLAMATALLVSREGSRRFQYGYWHIEPLVAAFNGAILMLLCLYATINALQILLTNTSQVISWDVTALYSGISCGVSLALWMYERRANRRLQSTLVRIDADGFLMSAVISAGVFAGFGLASLAGHAGWEIVARNADAGVLLILALGLLPLPMRILHHALREIFLIAPEALHRRVREAVDPVIARHGLLGYNSYAAKTGRLYRIDIHIIVPAGWCHSIETHDALRREIAATLEPEARLDAWLSVSFTGQPSWA
ncbi:cation diffusion facilitator family transporter [Robbsia andropogonis]|uniref:cation diffusion facilitator family transporter n=1 Tax=Robbsia andropogonis TaxID=28092 RepID=UPI003D1A3B9F